MNQKKQERQGKAFPVLMDDKVDPTDSAGNNDSVCTLGSPGPGGACEQQQPHEHTNHDASTLDPSVRKTIFRNKFRAFVRKYRIDQAAFRASSMFVYPVAKSKAASSECETSCIVPESKAASSECENSLIVPVAESKAALSEYETSLIDEAIAAGAFENAPDIETAALVSEIQSDIINLNSTIEDPSSEDDCVFWVVVAVAVTLNIHMIGILQFQLERTRWPEGF